MHKYTNSYAMIKHVSHSHVVSNEQGFKALCQACGEMDTGLIRCKASGRCSAMYHVQCHERTKASHGKCHACACLIPGAKPLWLR